MASCRIFGEIVRLRHADRDARRRFYGLEAALRSMLKGQASAMDLVQRVYEYRLPTLSREEHQAVRRTDPPNC